MSKDGVCEKSNMHYLFNRYYLEKMVYGVDNITEFNNSLIAQFNQRQGDFFVNNNKYIKKLKPFGCIVEYYRVLYPGVLVGLGYPHEVSINDNEKNKGQIVCGLSLDYVTGCPYIPGSSIKGIIKHAIKKYSGQYVGISDEDVDEDIFYGAYFAGEYIENEQKNCGKYNLIGKEYITPHKSITKNPMPISMLKIMPGTVLAVVYKINSKDELKKKIYNQIISDLGVGAKTNVGFGSVEKIEKEKVRKVENNIQKEDADGAGKRKGNVKQCESTKNNPIKYKKWKIGEYTKAQITHISKYTKLITDDNYEISVPLHVLEHNEDNVKLGYSYELKVKDLNENGKPLWEKVNDINDKA